MPNFFTDTDLPFHFGRLDLREVVAGLEDDYTSHQRFEDAPANYEQAMALYEAALESTGDIAGNRIAPLSAGIDAEGTRLVDGVVHYAHGTELARRMLSEAGLMGAILPREVGGRNFPASIYMMLIEMIARADASLMTMFGYQFVGDAIARWGDPAFVREFLAPYCRGEEVGAMVLSEPGAGSDLQSIEVRASQDDHGRWRLHGTKHFISNGNGRVLLVLARSDGEGRWPFAFSVFAVDGHHEGVVVQRIEDTMGLRGSPTCQLYFDGTPCELIGERRYGLMYVMQLLHHGRLAVAAQALGTAEAAYQLANTHTRQRRQFDQPLISLPPVAHRLAEMRVTLDAARSMLYDSAQTLDRCNRSNAAGANLGPEAGRGESTERFRRPLPWSDPRLSLLSPMVKYWVTEQANRICYLAQQLHGGRGYIHGLPPERHVRDVRITTIYEGATEVMIAMALKPVMADALSDRFNAWERSSTAPHLLPILDQLEQTRALCVEAAGLLRTREHSVRHVAGHELTDAYCMLYGAHLLLAEASELEGKIPIARSFASRALTRARAAVGAIESGLYDSPADAAAICG